MQKIVDHIEYNKHKLALAKNGILNIKQFRAYLKSRGWTQTINYWRK